MFLDVNYYLPVMGDEDLYMPLVFIFVLPPFEYLFK